MNAPAQSTSHACTGCGGKTRSIKPITLRALVADGVLDAEAELAGYRFCPNEACSIVYVRPSGGEEVHLDDLVVEVFQKSRNPSRPVCYCFDHRVKDVQRDALSGNPSIIEDIEEKCRNGLDRCEIENPQGRCCLGNVRAVAEAARAAADPQEASNCCAAKNKDDSEPPPVAAPGPPANQHRAGRLAAGGAMVTAVLSSACCWLPLALIGLGVSAGGLGAFFEAYRFVFLGVTSVLLGAGFYFVYVRKPACEADGTCAALSPRLARFNKTMLWVAAAFVAVFAFFPNYVGYVLGGDGAVSPAAASEQAEASTAVQRSYAITGMSCEGCTSHIQAELTKLPGVTTVAVSYQTSEAVVTFRDADDVDNDAVLAAIDELGFEARVK